ncbi:uncharacterized protein LOC120016120 isoform X2 [Tripterygium wilfordii]|uniref:uncharacterized protein LOC120016120 isoform X2 n=1 Tax=Tripterygium wilfordii TaxID=458696 RepID=UPI0018F84C39|nr:uncharacterized protein LOC120016120 isoform X2 [Tripterygium wilfordii]
MFWVDSNAYYRRLSDSEPASQLVFCLSSAKTKQSNMLSLEMSGSIPIEGEQEEGRTSSGGIVGEEKSPEVTSWMVASAEKNPALHRALDRIKAAEGCKFHKKLRIHTNRKRCSLMREASREINFSAETIDGYTEVLLHGSLEKTKETQLSNQEQLERFDLNLTLSLSGINDDNSKEKAFAQSSSVSSLIDLTKDSDELSNTLSFVKSCSIPMEADQDERRAIRPRYFQIEAQNSLEKQRSGADNIGEKKVSLPTAAPSRITPWEVSYVENNRALHRALSRIKKDEYVNGRSKLRNLCLPRKHWWATREPFA